MQVRNYLESMWTKIYYFIFYAKWAGIAAIPAVIIAPIRELFIREEFFFATLFVFLAFDFGLHFWEQWKAHNFDFPILFEELLKKTLLSLIFISTMILFVNQEGATTFGLDAYFIIFARFIVLYYPLDSMVMHMFKISKGKFPPLAWMKRYKKIKEQIMSEAEG